MAGEMEGRREEEEEGKVITDFLPLLIQEKDSHSCSKKGTQTRADEIWRQDMYVEVEQPSEINIFIVVCFTVRLTDLVPMYLTPYHLCVYIR